MVSEVTPGAKVFLFLAAVAILGRPRIEAADPPQSQMSPYDIHSWVQTGEDGIGETLWSRLGICETLHSHLSPCGTGIDSDYKLCTNNCESQLLTLDVLPDPGLEVVLLITDFTAYARLLVFRLRPATPSTVERWELVDHIDSGWSKYGDVEARAVELGGRPYLIMSETTGGTGAFSRYATWYEFPDGKARKALVVSEEERRAPLSANWDAKFDFDDYGRAGSMEWIRFQIQLHVDDVDGQRLFDRTVPIVFIRHPGEAEFAFDALGSDLAPDSAVVWWQTPPDPAATKDWEYGVLLQSAGIPKEQREQWVEEFRQRFVDNVR